MKEPLQFYSHGKLLITGEYLIVHGAKSLAVPLKLGQHLTVDKGVNGILNWKASVKDSPWFEASFNIETLEILETTDNQKALNLQKVLEEAKKLNSSFLSEEGIAVTTNLEYPQEWGLGSSSTFISNVAWWSKTDPMLLHQSISSGSGYDIACARSEKPILYQIKDKIPAWNTVDFHPPYSNHLYFAFLGKKQNTAESLGIFMNDYAIKQADIDFISDLTSGFLATNLLEEAIQILKEHELFMSGILKKQPVKERLFSDFNGAVKSLGAWGGDFVLVATPLTTEEVGSYFQNKGITALFKFDELVINGITTYPN